jgi:hypothetical protein
VCKEAGTALSAAGKFECMPLVRRTDSAHKYHVSVEISLLGAVWLQECLSHVNSTYIIGAAAVAALAAGPCCGNFNISYAQ